MLVLFTVGSPEAHALLQGSLPARVILQHAPLDNKLAMQAFLAHWRPQVGIFMVSQSARQWAASSVRAAASVRLAVAARPPADPAAPPPPLRCAAASDGAARHVGARRAPPRAPGGPQETPAWPAMVEEAAAAGVKLALLNGRMSSSSFLSWFEGHMGRALLQRLVSRFTLIVPQSDIVSGARCRPSWRLCLGSMGWGGACCCCMQRSAASPGPRLPATPHSPPCLLACHFQDVGRFRMLDASLGQMPGWCSDLKYAAALGTSVWHLWRPSAQRMLAVRKAVAGRPMWVAASTHAGGRGVGGGAWWWRGGPCGWRPAHARRWARGGEGGGGGGGAGGGSAAWGLGASVHAQGMGSNRQHPAAPQARRRPWGACTPRSRRTGPAC